VRPPLNGGALSAMSEGGLLEAVPQIEPSMVSSLAQDWAAVSAAVSAKRQADALERIAAALTGEGSSILTAPINSYGEGIGDAIQGQMVRGAAGISQY